MSIRVMTAVFDHSESRLADRLVLLVIADRSNDDGSGCWRGKESIAHMARVSRTTVTESVAHLEEMGELVVERRPGKTNSYLIVLPGVGQNPAGSRGGGPESGRAVGQTGGRGSARRVAAIHPDTSVDPLQRSAKEIRAAWEPEKVAEPAVVKSTLAFLRRQ